MKFGGKTTKTSSDLKRHFTVVIGGKEHGLYVSSTPSSAARKAVTKLCTANKSKKVEFSIREITQGSKKKTYGPYKGYIEKLKEPIELKGRVIRYKPVAKLGEKKSVQKDWKKDGKKDGKKGGKKGWKKGGKKGGQKGGYEFIYNAEEDKEYRAIHEKLRHDQNFLKEQEKDNLGFNNPIQNKFFTKAKTYLWTLKPNGYEDFKEESARHEDPKYYYGILRIRPSTLFKTHSIYIAFRVNISKRKLEIPKIKHGYYWGRYKVKKITYHSETIIELTFLAKGFGKEEFKRHLLRKNSFTPIYSSNRDRTIAELIELIQTKEIYEYNAEFRDLQIYFKENMSQLTNSFANAPPIPVLRFMQNFYSAPPNNINQERVASAPPLNAQPLNNRYPIESGASAPPFNLNNFASAPPFNSHENLLSGAIAPLLNNTQVRREFAFVFTGPYIELKTITDEEIKKLLKNIDCEIEISRKTNRISQMQKVLSEEHPTEYINKEVFADILIEVIVKITPNTFSNNRRYLGEVIFELKHKVTTLFPHFYKKKTRPSKNIKIFFRTYIDESEYQNEDITESIKKLL